MDIKVEVGPIGLDTIIGDHRVYDSREEEWTTEGMTLGQAIAAKVYEDLRREPYYGELQKTALKLRDEEIRAQLAPIVAEAIKVPVQKTNHYGEPAGQPVTMREVIVAEVEKLLKQPADQYRREQGTWANHLIRTEVEAALRKELGEVIAAEKAKVVAAVQAKASELIAEAVKAGIGR